MENSHRFFSNKECKYFPCHRQPAREVFNCLFCYCPLYPLGEKCGGDFEYSEHTKRCNNCCLPHIPAYYDTVLSKLRGAGKEVQRAGVE